MYFARNIFNQFVWVIFFLIYVQTRWFVHTFDLTHVSVYFKAAYHILFYFPLGLFLWRRELSVSVIIGTLVILSAAPELYQHYFLLHQWENSLIDISTNVGGGILGILGGMMWTVREIAKN